MATNNFLIFDQQQQNIMSDEAYSTNQQRLSGVSQGIASSQLHNKQAYQSSVMSNAIAQYITNHGLDATDSNATQLLNNFSQSVKTDIAEYSGDSLKDSSGKRYEPVMVQYPNTYEKLGVNGYYSPDGTKVFSILNSSRSGFTLKCTTPDGTEIYSSDIAYSTSSGTWDLITYIDDKYLGICQGTGKACWVSYTDTGAQFVSACATGSTPNYTRSDIKALYLSDLYRSPDYMIAGNYETTNSKCYLYSRTDGSALGQITMSSVNDTVFGLCVTPENVAYCLWISGGNYYVHQGVLSGISLSTSKLFNFNSGYNQSYAEQTRASSIYFYDDHLYIVVNTSSNTYELRKYDTSGTLVASLSINNGSRAFIGHYLICGTSMYDLDTMSQITSPSYYGPYMTLNSSSYALGTGSLGYAFLKPLTASRGVVVSTSALPFLSSNVSPYACYFREVD